MKELVNAIVQAEPTKRMQMINAFGSTVIKDMIVSLETESKEDSKEFAMNEINRFVFAINSRLGAGTVNNKHFGIVLDQVIENNIK